MSCARATTRDISRRFAFFSVIVSVGCMRVAEQAPPDRTNPVPPGVERKGPDFLRQIAPYAPSTNPHDRERGAKCHFCSKIKVHIVALGDTYTIDPAKPPTPGRPVAQLTNLDSKKIEKYYGLLPGVQADYYLWVDANSSGQARWTLLELSHATDSVYAALPTDLRYCKKYDTTRKTDADFAEYKHDSCVVRYPDPIAKVSQASLLPSPLVAVIQNVVAFLAFASTGGGWISCSNGCCT
jgi:hypothetical protein